MDSLLPQLQNCAQRAFPDRPGLQVSQFTAINDGWESEVYSFVIAWETTVNRQQEELILRLMPGGDGYNKAGREFDGMRRLYKAGYPVPQVYWMERDTPTLGKPFMIMEKAPGEGMWGPMFHGNPDQQQALLVLFCQLFTRLHRLDWRLLVEHPETDPHDDPYAIINAQLAEWRPHISQSPLTGFIPVFHWLEQNYTRVPCRQPAVVHLDFHPKNILITTDYQAKVIDWTQVGVHDARMDLAWTLLLVECYESLERRQSVQDEYERQIGAPMEHLEYYDVAACLKRLYGTVFSISAGAESMGMRPGAEEIMRQQVPQIGVVYRRMLGVTGIHVAEVEKLLA